VDQGDNEIDEEKQELAIETGKKQEIKYLLFSPIWVI
jgi:hypothetical protein